jgi:hypothetical protein
LQHVIVFLLLLLDIGRGVAPDVFAFAVDGDVLVDGQGPVTRVDVVLGTDRYAGEVDRVAARY